MWTNICNIKTLIHVLNKSEWIIYLFNNDFADSAWGNIPAI